jgi:hypothetical protein
MLLVVHLCLGIHDNNLYIKPTQPTEQPSSVASLNNIRAKPVGTPIETDSII